MNRTSLKFYFLSLLCLIFFLPSCKPTEKNYKNAYDAALKKKENIGLDYGLGGNVRVEAMDAPRKIVYNNKEYQIRTEYVSPTDKKIAVRPKYLAVISKYTMDTNAKSQIQNLITDGFPNAILVKDREGKFLVVADYSETLEDIIMKADKFKKRYPEHPYIGLYGDILILEKP